MLKILMIIISILRVICFGMPTDVGISEEINISTKQSDNLATNIGNLDASALDQFVQEELDLENGVGYVIH